MRYADLLDRDRNFNNQDTRNGLDRSADRLIRDAQAFINETWEEAARAAEAEEISPDTLTAPPRPA